MKIKMILLFILFSLFLQRRLKTQSIGELELPHLKEKIEINYDLGNKALSETQEWFFKLKNKKNLIYNIDLLKLFIKFDHSTFIIDLKKFKISNLSPLIEEENTKFTFLSLKDNEKEEFSV